MPFEMGKCEMVVSMVLSLLYNLTTHTNVCVTFDFDGPLRRARVAAPRARDTAPHGRGTRPPDTVYSMCGSASG